MPWWTQILSTIIFVIGIAVTFLLVMHVNALKSQELPDRRIDMLKDLSEIAAKAVEKNFHVNPDKSSIAIGMVLDYYQEYQLLPPSRVAIERAVDAAFFSATR